MSDINDIKAKLAKLLRLGEHQSASEGEIDNALRIASQLMARHQLTRDDLDLEAADPVARVAMGRHFAFCKGGTVTTWECVLLQFVAEFIGPVKYYNAGKMPVRRNGMAMDFFGGADGSPPMAAAVAFYGPDEDAHCAVSMFEELRDAVSTMAIIRWGGWARGDGAIYAYGFAAGLRDANQRAKLELRNDNATTALIIQNEKMQLAIVTKAKDWLAKECNVRIATSSSKRKVYLRTASSSTALAEGRRDGSNYAVTRSASRTGSRQRIA